jgi:predicted phage baseplate assembly protein
VILKAPDDEEHPILTLEQSLQYSYDPASATIYANVVEATHGATISEILGSGNGTLTNQQFTLSKPPLTHTAAMTPSGGKSSLNVYVNDVKWTEDSSLYALNTQNQSYILQIEDDGTTIITFGDGQRGARLPSGRENITATYRSGMGLSGQIEAGQISLKKTGPASILSVTNPLPASGAADPESITSAQKSVPATTRTLDRIVSLQDFEDFAQAFAGVAQAQAVALWNGETELVHITIAAIAGATVTPESALYQSLVQAINAARDPIQQVQIDSYLPKFFRLEAKFFVLPRYQSDKVEADIRKQLTEKFAFDRRQFGQAVTKSEVIAAIQSVDGVQAVGLDALHYRDASRTLQSVLLAQTAHWDSQTRQIQPAQLLRLNASDIVLTLVQSL